MREDKLEKYLSGDAEKGQPVPKGRKPGQRRRRSVMQTQNAVIAILLVCTLLLGVGYGVASYIFDMLYFIDSDDVQYRIKKTDDGYALFHMDGTPVDASADGTKGHFAADSGNIIKVDSETGAASIYAYLDELNAIEDGESMSYQKKILMFKQISRDADQLDYVEIHNQSGSYRFYRYEDTSGSAAFGLEVGGQNYKTTPFNQVLFSSLVVSAGYPLTMQKIDDPIKDENGQYTEYGLYAETRYDEEGKPYEYSPTWYRIADRSGNEFTVRVGDQTPDGAGYYVQYLARDAVYVMSLSVENSYLNMYGQAPSALMSKSITNVFELTPEDFASPTLVSGMSLNNYFDVKDFAIFSKGDGEEMKKLIEFSFLDMEEREGTYYANMAYMMTYPESYEVNSNTADTALQSFYDMQFIRTVKLGVTSSALREYGLDDPAYKITFTFNNYKYTMKVSKMTDDGTFFITSGLYDMIVEVERSELEFLNYGMIDWVDPDMFFANLAWITDIKLTYGDLYYSFMLDNSLSDSVTNPEHSDDAKEEGTIDSGNMTATIVKTDNKTGKQETLSFISTFEIVDMNGITWRIDDEMIYAKNSEGKSVSIKGAAYVDNDLGENVAIFANDGRVIGKDGTEVFVSANYITVVSPDGVTTKYLRYGMSLVRKFYQSILYTSYEGDVHSGASGLTDEEIADYMSRDDSECQMKLEINTSAEGHNYIYRFYRYSERRSLVTVNGAHGEFYIISSRIDKLAADAEKVLLGQFIDPTGA